MSMRRSDTRPRCGASLGITIARMDPTSDLAAARLSRFLEQENVLWLSSVGANGAPHLVPTWFVWDGDVITVLSTPGARKVRNLAADPRVMVALGDADDDFDVGMLEGTAEAVPGTTPPGLPAGFVAKYADRITDLGLTPAQFAAIYSQVIRIRPRHALGWHGRSVRASVIDAARRVTAAGRASRDEPRAARPALREWLGEPLGRGPRVLTPAPSGAAPA